jgi:replicative DNA helicase
MDKLPPYAPEAEKCIIGSCLIDPKIRLPECQMVITNSEFFYQFQCQIVWDTINAMSLETVNFVSVIQKLRDGTPEQKSVTLEFMSECQDMVTSAANLPTWLEEVEKKFIARKVISVCTRAVASMYEGGDVMAMLDGIESSVLGIRPAERNTKDIKSLMREATGLIEQRSQNWDLVLGHETGFSDLDRKTDGIHGGEFIVIGAPTSCGKTALALNIIVHNALNGVPSGILSAEMLPVKLALRSLCAESRVNFKRIAETDVSKMIANIGRIANSPIHMDTINGFTIGQVRALARRMKQLHRIKILAIENIQLLQGKGDTREQQISDISRGMKGIALELDIAVLGLSQLNDDNRLRESRAIGHDADSVWIIENDGPWQPAIQPVKLNVEKCRDGETGIVPLMFFKEHTRFEQPSKIADDDVPNGED